jgi:hypothetical protein
MGRAILLINTLSLLAFLLIPQVLTRVHDVHSLSVYRGLVNDGLLHEENSSNSITSRQREDAIVNRLRKIGGVGYYYRVVCWFAAFLLIINSAYLVRLRAWQRLSGV